ncbi:MAG TPA: DUF1501 domain-containing protein [Planctomycetaceae bacterium]|nr:DUF1501 domain-containing protein [Planctomycetaceae bacterium]
MTDRIQHVETCSRRDLLARTGYGLGSIALSSMLSDDLLGAPGSNSDSSGVRETHFPAKSKNVIFLHMVGGPSHLELFEFKPKLVEFNGQNCPQEFLAGQRFAFIRGTPKLLGTHVHYNQYGESGLPLSELLPHLSQHADDLCLIKTLHGEHFNHAPAQLFFQTGFGRFGRPSMGAWVTYGLGSANRNLPGFVVLITGSVAGAGNSLWGNGFLPSAYQGIEFRSQGDPVLFLSNPKGIERDDRKRIVDGINDLNREQFNAVGDPEIEARISQYELAYRMQSSVPELMNIAGETKATHEMYGTEPGKTSFANNCLLARRLVERGVRFVQLFDEGWDHHSSVFNNMQNKCKQVDRPIAALLADLKQRGLLDETLVVWGGEFGRTPLLQGAANDGTPNKNAGRDHHKDAYCVWIAGGGSNGGAVYGETDELGYYPTKNPVHVNDFHATLLHLLGLDHERLTYKFQGRNFRLTDVAGHVVHDIIA